jgi:uncharacterized protein
MPGSVGHRIVTAIRTAGGLRHTRRMDDEARVREIVAGTPWLMRALRAAREVDAPEWLISAGAVRTAVWDHLHGHAPPTPPTPPADVDLGFFDPDDLAKEREARVERALRAELPDVPWDAKNQARVHLWYERRFGHPAAPLSSTADAVATFPETASCVGVRLTAAGEIVVVAPLGLGDLLGLVHRHNPRLATVEEYERRLAAKRIAERWPRVTMVAAR